MQHKWMQRAAIVAVGLWTAAAGAALVVRVQDADVTAGGTVYLDAYVQTDGTETESVNTFVIGLTTQPPAGGGFTDAVRTDEAGGTRPMLLGTAPFESLGVTPLTADGLQMLADANAGVPLATANGLGLIRVAFAVPANAAAGDTYSVQVDETFTSFSTPGANSGLIDYTSVAGTVTVVIPEPAGLLLAAAAVPLLLRRRRDACR